LNHTRLKMVSPATQVQIAECKMQNEFSANAKPSDILHSAFVVFHLGRSRSLLCDMGTKTPLQLTAWLSAPSGATLWVMSYVSAQRGTSNNWH